MNARASRRPVTGIRRKMTDEPSSSMAADPAPEAVAAYLDRSSCADVVLEAPEWRRRLPFVEGYVAEVVGATLARVTQGKECASGTEKCEIAVLLTSDERMQALNRQFRGRDRATNVLSFPQIEPTQPERRQLIEGEFLGDVAVAFETVAREAEDAGIALEHHLAHMVTHGCLHLLGHTHDASTDSKVMEALESEILFDLGIANPYAARDQRNGHE